LKLAVVHEKIKDGEGVVSGLAKDDHPAAATALVVELGGEMRICAVAEGGVHPSSQEDVLINCKLKGDCRTEDGEEAEKADGR
jgi:hypothetical protein